MIQDAQMQKQTDCVSGINVLGELSDDVVVCKGGPSDDVVVCCAKGIANEESPISGQLTPRTASDNMLDGVLWRDNTTPNRNQDCSMQ